MSEQSRKVVGNISLSLDGRITGRNGAGDMGWVVPHAVTETSRDHMVQLTRNSTTGLLGRNNYEGFGGYWPMVARDGNAEPRDRAFAQWLDAVEKVVFSSTLTEAPWQNSRISRDPVAEVKQLREQPGGDIIVLSSSSIIRALLAADELDRLVINLCPELVGGGAKLFEDGIPQSSWTLTDLHTSSTGATYLIYDRKH
ncbi:dihydrofolate reductase family protein [Kribbella sp. CA-247076]|uniref:dihydrofolate reductase family protein n=1 Tax=Kribbella sp. CA-247076 TaxID=3239941 RepID=UPI003D94871B